MTCNIYLIRGLPGSGKTTLAGMIRTVAGLSETKVLSADDYFSGPNDIGQEQHKKDFDPKLLPKAHEQCLSRTKHFWFKGCDVVVTNTFSQRWELEPYLELYYHALDQSIKKLDDGINRTLDEANVLRFAGSKYFVMDLFDGGKTNLELAKRNVHGVNVKTIANMRNRWEHDWQMGDPKPPYHRRRIVR